MAKKMSLVQAVRSNAFVIAKLCGYDNVQFSHAGSLWCDIWVPAASVASLQEKGMIQKVLVH
jgi:hypothetical protein